MASPASAAPPKTPLDANANNFVGTKVIGTKPFGIARSVLTTSALGTTPSLVNANNAPVSTPISFPRLSVKGIPRVSLPNYAAKLIPQFDGAIVAKPVQPPSLRLSAPQLKTQVPVGSLLNTRLFSRGTASKGGVNVIKECEDHDVVQIGEHVAARMKHGIVRAVSPKAHEPVGDGEFTPERMDKPMEEEETPHIEEAHVLEPAGCPLTLESEEPLLLNEK